MQKDILLVALNATYPHSSLGIRYLFANLEELQPSAKMVELTIKKDILDMAEELLAHRPKIVGLGVYIWNAAPMRELVSTLKRVAPEVLIVLGGPEVSYGSEDQALCQKADHILRGEGDFLFRKVCRALLEGESLPKFLGPEPVDLGLIKSPYPYYSQEDIAHRVIAVESSRGCPFRCEYCLSAVTGPVRRFALDDFLRDMEQLIERGARMFKFIDRSFNIEIPSCIRLLEFFLGHMPKGLFLHFEMVPDGLPQALRDMIARFPPGSLQFEIGLQTWNPDVARHIRRQNNYEQVTDNFRFLASLPSVHVHADLLVGLPGEDLDGFAQGFDRLFALGPDEIQVGLLKRLRGAPIARHDEAWQMVYSEAPPYVLLKNKLIDFNQMQQLAHFAKHWDMLANQKQFQHTMGLIHDLAQQREDCSMFWQCFDISRYLAERHGQSYGIALQRLVESLWCYFTEVLNLDAERVRQCLIQDYSIEGRRDIPAFLRNHPTKPRTRMDEAEPSSLPKILKRQGRQASGPP